MENLIKERLELINQTRELLKTLVIPQEEKENIKDFLINQFLYEDYIDDYTPEQPIEELIVNTVADLKKQDLKIGDVISTKGYYTVGDGGEAKYIIKDYDYYLNEWLPFDCKKIGYKSNKLGTDLMLKDSPVDEFANHTVSNGLVACLLNKDNVTPEQYGAKGDGNFNNTINFQYLFAHMKHGRITFKENGVYMIGQRTDILPEGYENYANPYGAYMGGRGCNCIYPTMANVDGVELIGNKATIKIKDNDWNNKGQGNDFAILNLFRVIRNLNIHDLIFDNNGLTMDETHSVENHGISWKSGNNRIDGGKFAPTVEDGTISEISNFEVYNCEFKNGGTTKPISDCGGDGILIINPMENSHDINIHDNKFINWGRWCFAIDLGGNGECIENVKFNNNICVQDEKNLSSVGKSRGLGWIDFEARKCFKNLEVNNNYIYGANGWAFNGNNKVSENISVVKNTIITPNYIWASKYPYNFNFYYVQTKNLIFEDNDFSKSIGTNRLGNVLYNASIKRNKFSNSPLSIYKPYGDILIEDNERGDMGIIVGIAIIGELPNTLTKEEKDNPYCNISFNRNKGGFSGNIFDVDNPGKYRYINLNIEENRCSRFNLVALDCINRFVFNPKQINSDCLAFSCRGAVFTDKTTYNYAKRINGGGIYREGETIAENDTERTICTSSGYVPMQGSAGYCDNDIPLTYNRKVGKNSLIYSSDKLYVAKNNGVLSGEVTEDVEGNIYSGDVSLLYVTDLAKFKSEKLQNI